MNLHEDGLNNYGYPNFLLCLSSKGIDYDRGGGYYKINNEIIEVEDKLSPGDLYIHDIDVKHGVKAIDPHSELEIENYDKGRWVINVSLEKLPG